jgi:hypothetical protein
MGHIARVGEMRNAYKILFWRTEGRTQLERPIGRWEYNIKRHFKEVCFGAIDWIHVAQDMDW